MTRIKALYLACTLIFLASVAVVLEDTARRDQSKPPEGPAVPLAVVGILILGTIVPYMSLEPKLRTGDQQISARLKAILTKVFILSFAAAFAGMTISMAPMAINATALQNVGGVLFGAGILVAMVICAITALIWWIKTISVLK